MLEAKRVPDLVHQAGSEGEVAGSRRIVGKVSEPGVTLREERRKVRVRSVPQCCADRNRSLADINSVRLSHTDIGAGAVGGEHEVDVADAIKHSEYLASSGLLIRVESLETVNARISAIGSRGGRKAVRQQRVTIRLIGSPSPAPRDAVDVPIM